MAGAPWACRGAAPPRAAAGPPPTPLGLRQAYDIILSVKTMRLGSGILGMGTPLSMLIFIGIAWLGLGLGLGIGIGLGLGVGVGVG